jgi:hypothetical protein
MDEHGDGGGVTARGFTFTMIHPWLHPTHVEIHDGTRVFRNPFHCEGQKICIFGSPKISNNFFACRRYTYVCACHFLYPNLKVCNLEIMINFR